MVTTAQHTAIDPQVVTDQQRATLLEIAERCPVHRTLHSEVLISTTQASHGTGGSPAPPLN